MILVAISGPRRSTASNEYVSRPFSVGIHSVRSFPDICNTTMYNTVCTGLSCLNTPEKFLSQTKRQIRASGCAVRSPRSGFSNRIECGLAMVQGSIALCASTGACAMYTRSAQAVALKLLSYLKITLYGCISFKRIAVLALFIQQMPEVLSKSRHALPAMLHWIHRLQRRIFA